jgi:hypothetical protein
MVVYSGFDPQVTNLIMSPSANVSTGLWSAMTNSGGGTGAAFTRDTSQVFAVPSTGSFRFTSGSDTAAGGTQFSTMTINLTDVVSDYSIGARVRNSQTVGEPYMTVQWYSAINAGGSLLQTDTIQKAYGTFSTGTWIILSMEGLTPPLGALSVKVTIGQINQNLNGGVNWSAFDGIMFHVGSKLTTYIDGAQGPDYHWTGTAYQSTSYRDALALAIPSGKLGIARVTPQLYRANRAGALSQEVTKYMIDASVEMRTDRTIRKLLHAKVSDPNKFTAFSDYIAPVLTIKYSDGSSVSNQLGLYTLIPTETDNTQSGISGGFEAYDIIWGLSETSFGFPFTVSAGSNIIGAVLGIANAEGYKTNIPMPSPGIVAAKTLTYDINWSKLKVMNRLLTAAGYYECWGDAHGYITSFPYIDWSTAPPNKVLASGLGSEVVGSIRREPDYASIYNKVRVIKEDTSNPVNNFVVTLTNANPKSPVSTVNLGRVRMMEPLVNNDIPNSTIGNQIARKMLQEAASFHVRYQVSTLLDPFRGVHEFYDAAVNQSNGLSILAGSYHVSGWDLPMNAHEPMTHYLNRVEEYQ